jgi:hypothetical protein
MCEGVDIGLIVLASVVGCHVGEDHDETEDHGTVITINIKCTKMMSSVRSRADFSDNLANVQVLIRSVSSCINTVPEAAVLPPST